MTPCYQLLLSRIGYWRAHGEGVQLRRGEEAFAGETSVSLMLSNEKNEKTICQVGGINLLYKPDENDLRLALNELLSNNHLTINNIDAVVTGVSGNKANDEVYFRNVPALFANKPIARYKHIFGESYTAAGLGMSVAAKCLQKRRIPGHMLLNNSKDISNVKALLLYNHWEGKNHSLTLLASC
jgi:3-oxoacyl-(acyl-carrier-protein) synthase